MLSRLGKTNLYRQTHLDRHTETHKHTHKHTQTHTKINRHRDTQPYKDRRDQHKFTIDETDETDKRNQENMTDSCL